MTPLTKRDAMLAELDASAKASPSHGDIAKRGEAALVEWTKDKEMLVSSRELATAWGLTRQGLAEAAERNELFLIKIRRRLWAPAAFVGLERDDVSAVCSAMANHRNGGDPRTRLAGRRPRLRRERRPVARLATTTQPGC